MSSVNFKPIDPKRDEFRLYLERAGVIEALTKVVIRLVKERPQNPLEYLRTNLGDAKQEADELNYLQKELEDARNEIEHLRKLIKDSDVESEGQLNLEEQTTSKAVCILENKALTRDDENGPESQDQETEKKPYETTTKVE